MGYKDIQFPSGTRILVTGAAGFIGSNLVEALLYMGVFVRGLDNFSTGKKENLADFINHPNFDFIQGDIRDEDTCLAACNGIDYVLHQAALGSVPRSILEPMIYLKNNIHGTANMMEAALRQGVKRFVYASSSSVYGDSQALPKVEGSEGEIISPYALTKLVNEHYGALYTSVYGLECIGLRYFNVFGKKQDCDSQYSAVIPKFIKALKAGQQAEIYGDGEQSRDFTFIENVIDANLRSCVAPEESCGRAYNIAYGERFTVNQMYDLMCNLLGIDLRPQYVELRKGDIKHSLADISNAKTLLGYNPQWSFNRGFEEAVKWYQENL